MRVPILLTLFIGIPGIGGAQALDVPADTVIRLERTSCYGPCPIYSVTIDARGTVTYEGVRAVRVVGRQMAQIDPSLVTTLLASAERIQFFELRDAYRVIENPDGTVTSVIDLPTTIVTITVNGRTKRVEDYIGAPDVLGDFERAIDEAAGTKRWVFFDEEALAALRRSGWSASGEEGARLLKQAIERDDVVIARTLIEMGADLGGPPQDRLPPLRSARSASMVELLVKAGADPNERAIDRGAMTPLMSASYKDAAVAEALLKAGARLEDVDYGHTALWYAACAGNWRVVTVLLRAGANPRGAAAGMSAIECTQRGRRDEMSRRRTVLDRGRPTVEDFDQVIALLENAGK